MLHLCVVHNPYEFYSLNTHFIELTSEKTRHSQRMIKISTLLTLSITLLTTSLLAENWKSNIPPFDPSNQQPLTPTQLSYTLSWNGTLKAGILNFQFGKKDKRYPSMYVSQAYGGSTGPAALLFPYKYTLTSFTQKGSYKPAVSIAYENDHKKSTTTTNRYKSNGVEHAETKVELRTKKKTQQSHKFPYANSHGAISAMLNIRGKAFKKGDVYNLCLHPFSSPYYANITVLGREVHRDRPAIKLDVRLRKIDRDTNLLKSYKKLRKATLWISDDAQRIPIELRTKVFIGDVRAVLSSQKPL